MSILGILDTVLIGPLKLVFEIIFDVANRLTGHSGLSIIALSLIMNILVLPLYRRADAMQEEARDIENKLHDGVAHIKKTFSGDERMMIMQAYYRQNDYSPLSALNGSVSLLLEIPFFIAAYQFLSHVGGFSGVAFGPIPDLGAPDGLIKIGGLTLNLLPILMTLINVVSSAIYLKGFPLKTKLQLYAMAAFFLVFLYDSPACLVFYWTLNNVFSLVKNVFYKLKHPGKVLNLLTTAVGIAIICFGLFVYSTTSLKRKVFVVGVGVILLLPLLYSVLKRKIHIKLDEPAPNRKNFVLGAALLTFLIGIYIPSTYIAASPQEYVDITYVYNPLWYVVSSLSYAAGSFLVWMSVFYWLASPRGKELFERVVWVLCAVMLADYMFFATNTGIISATLQYEVPLVFTSREQMINLAVLVVIALVVFFAAKKWSRPLSVLVLTATIALGCMSAINVATITSSFHELLENRDSRADEVPSFELSTEGNNVVVIMLDRAMNLYVPYIFNEKPEIAAQFEGFTYYSNTISYGGFTNMGSPALLGGYEYTPVEMNKRSSESLVSKHNEALKMMPVLFSENGYQTTVCDPSYANYQWVPDLSIFDEYPEISAYISKGQFNSDDLKQAVIDNNLRNFFCFSVMKTMPLPVQTVIYNNGRYCQAAFYNENMYFSAQYIDNRSRATGISNAFMERYNVLCNMDQMTTISQDDTNTFLFLANETTHEPMLLQVPEYEPAKIVNNTEYDAAHTDRFTLNGRTLKMDNETQMSHYHSNVAALARLGEWFDYLRENGVYDNTRIILVADHGQMLQHTDELFMGDRSTALMDVTGYYPLLMVKDFNSTEFKTSDEFMTNADVPALAVDGLIENPVNPFTGKGIDNSEKYAHEQFVLMSWDWDVEKNDGNTYNAGQWASVKDNMWNPDNWTFYSGTHVLSEHTAP